METSSAPAAASSRIPACISSLRSNRHHTLLLISSRISLRRPIALRVQTLTAAVRSQSAAARASDPSPVGSQSQSFFRAVLANMEKSSTVADATMFDFADGVTESVPCSYIEFAERLTLPRSRNSADEMALRWAMQIRSSRALQRIN